MLYKTWTMWNENSSQWNNTTLLVSARHMSTTHLTMQERKLKQNHFKLSEKFMSKSKEFFSSGLLNTSAEHVVVQHVKKHLKTESFKQGPCFWSFYTFSLCDQQQGNACLILPSVKMLLQLDIFTRWLPQGRWGGWGFLFSNPLSLVLVSGYKGQDSPNAVQSIL